MTFRRCIANLMMCSMCSTKKKHFGAAPGEQHAQQVPPHDAQRGGRRGRRRHRPALQHRARAVGGGIPCRDDQQGRPGAAPAQYPEADPRHRLQGLPGRPLVQGGAARRGEEAEAPPSSTSSPASGTTATPCCSCPPSTPPPMRL